MKVLLIAAPLMARSGVYRSALDLVAAARAAGREWRAAIGVRSTASGRRDDSPAVLERSVERHGLALFREVRELIDDALTIEDPDVIITLIPQSDMVVHAGRRYRSKRRIAYVRGLPWPGHGEQSPVRGRILRWAECRALRRADEVWATSPLLAGQIASARQAFVVPAGVPTIERTTDGSTNGPLVWAGRLSPEKGAEEFVRLTARVGGPARIHGEGPLATRLHGIAPPALEWRGWTPADQLWQDAGIALCTSHREAFGRSPVEAACAGVPVVLSDQTGVAPLLYTDPDLRSRFVLPLGAADRWDDAIRSLRQDDALRRRVSEHVHRNASALTIEASFRAVLERLRSAPAHTPDHDHRPQRIDSP